MIQAYPAEFHDDAWEMELAELVDGELGPSLVTVLLPLGQVPEEAQVLLADSELPLAVLREFMTRVAAEERRLQSS